MRGQAALSEPEASEVNLDLDPTQELLRDTVRDYLSSEVPLDRIRELEREQRWDETLWKALRDQGWLSLPFAEAQGGGGGSLVDVGLLVEEFARRAAIVPVVETLACGIALERHAPGARSHALVESMLEGSLLPVPAVLEADDVLGSVSMPLRDGRVTGEKRFVDYGQFASHHLVAARDGDEPVLCLVDAASAEVLSQPLRTIARTPSAVVRYDGAAAERVAGPEAVAALMMLGRALAAVQCVGSAGQALDQTVAYASVRVAFGRPIGSFQAVKHHAANMHAKVVASRQLAYEALFALERGEASPAQVAFAKASASRTVPEVTMLAHQIHGGNGIIEENDLYFFTLRGKERSLAWGSLDECLADVAMGIDTPVAWLG
jgi:alkylation response protein AidB-like acyl-CoA dehydrogenase